MKLKSQLLLTLLVGILSFSNAFAATVTLKDGRQFIGDIQSQDKETLILDMDGIEMRLPVKNITSIDLTDTAKKETEEKETEKVAKGPITLQAGTSLTIRMLDSVNSRNHKTGHKFSAILEANIMSGDVVAVPKGAQVYGVLSQVKKAGRLAGSATLVLELTDITVNNSMVKIATQAVGGEGKNTAKTTVGRTARTAAIGGLIDGSDGAKTGAKVGLGLSVLTKGNDIQVPKDTLMDFVLRTPLKL